MRKPIIGGNWKMNTTVSEASDLAGMLSRHRELFQRVETVLFPPFPNIEAVSRIVQGSGLQLGGQDVFWEDWGAFTGEVSGPMLRAVGCGWVLVGHSERRRLLGESSRVVNKKLLAGLRNGLRAILAVGETREERDAGSAEDVLADQLSVSLSDVPAKALADIVIAYEPVWAIGTGDTATVAQAGEAHAAIRRIIAGLYGDRAASEMPVQYGGSVTADNAEELLAAPGIDGALVGGASLKPEAFVKIIQAAERVRQDRA